MAILTSASSGPKEKSLLKIIVYSSGHLRRYFFGLKTDRARFHVVIAMDLSFYVNFVTPRERTHKQKDLPVLPGRCWCTFVSKYAFLNLDSFPTTKAVLTFLHKVVFKNGVLHPFPILQPCPLVAKHVCIPLHSHLCY